jgi:hypothetical protein
MGFLFPEFLFALLLIAIPVIIHLFNFRKFKKVYFSNVRLLKAIEIQTIAAQKLKERLILASRILAIIFLVLAFSQPFITNKNNTNPSINNAVSIYLDNSYSMEAVNKNGTLLDEGKRKVREILNAYSLNDKFQLISNNFEGKQQRLISKEELEEQLNSISITPLTRDFNAIINRQKLILGKANGYKKIAYLISDFQKQTGNNLEFTLDTTINQYFVPLESNSLPNISIDSVYFLSPFHQPNQKESLVVVAKNHSLEDANEIPLKLNINGVQKAIGSLNIKAGLSQKDTLSFSGLAAGWQKGLLSIKDYPITFDDNFYFSFEVKSKLEVFAVYQDKPVSNISLAYQTDNFFKVKEVNQSQINYSSLSQYALIILENLETVSDGLSQQIKQYVEKGGSLSVFLPVNSDLASYQKFLANLNTDYPLALIKEPIKGKYLDLKHPIFRDVFEQIPKNIDLPNATQYFTSSKLVRTTQQILLNGENSSPLISNYHLKSGEVYLSFLPLNTEVSNFSKHALFLPFLFKMALLSSKEQMLFKTIGKENQIMLNSMNVSEKDKIIISGSATEIIPEVIKTPSKMVLNYADQLIKPGYYEVKLNDSLINVFGLNEDRAESALSFYDQAEIAQYFKTSNKFILNHKNEPVNQQIESVNLGFPLWKICIILTILFLLIEVLLIRFFNQKLKN